MRRGDRRFARTAATLAVVALAGAGGLRAAQRVTEARVYAALGRRSIGLAPLNAGLARGGAAPLPSGFGSLGGGGYVLVNGILLLGASGVALSGGGLPPSGPAAALRGGCGFFDVGYVVWRRGPFRLVPTWGVGAGSLTLRARRPPAAFGWPTGAPDEVVSATTSAVLFKYGALAELLPARGRGAIALGLSAGYVVATAVGEWTCDGAVQPGVPGIALSGPYVALTLGAGARTRWAD